MLLFFIFVLLFNAFQSVRHTLLILLNVPFAMIGGIIALLITGIPLSVSAAIGFIALFGQSVLNGVVMISVFNQLLARGYDPEQAVVEGALLRMRTVLMTTLLAMLGLLPMALSHGIGSETQKPLAIVIIGGLVTGTLLVLVVLPALFLAMMSRSGSAGSSIPRAAIAAMLLPLLFARCAHAPSLSQHDVVATITQPATMTYFAVLGRLVSLAMSLGIIWSVGEMARRVAGARAGLLAAIACSSLSPSLIRARSSEDNCGQH